MSGPGQPSQHRGHVLVVGGGISGLAAAYFVRELAAQREFPVEVTLLEGGTRLGGSLYTVRENGFVMETGADSLVSEKPWGLELVRRLGLESELVGTQERFRKTYVVRAGGLVEVPEGFALLAPARFGPVFRSPVFSLKGKLRMAMEPLVPRRRGGGDESLGSFVRRRLGREVLQRIAQPLAGGIYNADPEILSLEATMPRFLEMERRYGSLYRGMRAAQKAQAAQGAVSGARWSLFLSFKGGVGALADALASRLEGCVRFGAQVAALERRDLGAGAAGWRVVTADGSILAADAVICATPAWGAAALLKPHDPKLADILLGIGYSSAATVNFGYRLEDFPRPPDSFGFVVPAIENRKIIAGSFSSLKFPGRAPEGKVLLRAFLGGTLQARMMRLTDGEMIAAARQEFRELLGVEAEPLVTHVERWPHSMPQYAVGHLARVDEIERRARELGGIALCGSAYRGVGMPDCIHGAELAAQAVLSEVAGGGDVRV